MSDLYLEELVKKKRTGKDSALRMGLMVLTAVMVVLALLSWNLIIIVAAIAVCVADIFIFPRFNTEWEYQYVNGEVDVDRILNKAKRKRIASFDISNAEILAPASSHRLDYYNNNPKMKVSDYSSHDPERERNVYAMIVSNEGQITKILFEPSEKMLKDLRTKAPRKVFFD
ncbi:MAG: DUF6106 family protein [Oliverpabstia sp.]|nr:DUF6106 family protein [Lachnospiraceae bacterium]MDY5026023.1 DUF6106 family protein [Oliverpabstia sp.]